MIYIKELPTETGFYWVKLAGKEEVVEICIPSGTKNLFVYCDGKFSNLDLPLWKGAQWAGPVPKAKTGVEVVREFIQFSQEWIKEHGYEDYREKVLEDLAEEREILLYMLNQVENKGQQAARARNIPAWEL